MEEAFGYVRARPRRDYEYRTTLGIDWGSEAVRAKLLRKADGGQIVDKLFQHVSRPGEWYDRWEIRGQHTSHIYPFGRDVVESPNPPATAIYPGNKLLMSQQSISSKIAMYAVVGIPDEVASQAQELRLMCDLAEQRPELKRNIRIGIEQMLTCVLQNIHDSLPSNPDPGSDIDAIELTTPAQWTIEFEEEYGARLTRAWHRVFGRAPPQIIFLSEGQTNAHYLFWRGTPEALSDRQDNLPRAKRDFFSVGETKNAVLMIDAGGHSTNTSLVTICEDGNQLEIRADRGAIGGTYLWARAVLEKLVENLARREVYIAAGNSQRFAEIRNQALQSFYYNLPAYRRNARDSFNFLPHCHDEELRSGSFITGFDIVQTFDSVHEPVFQLIEDGIRELKALQPSCEKIKIVVGGGSSQGLMWVERLINLCDKYEVGDPIFLMEIDRLYEHARLAAGANYALAEAKSVPRFVSKAAFGLAVKKRYKVGNVWTSEWDCQATLLWAQGQKWTRVVKTNGSLEFKVICQPEFDDPQADSIIETDYRAYDLLEIPCRKRGPLKFDFEIDVGNDTLKLKVSKKLGRSQRWTALGAVEFDLWVPPGSRTLQIWQCEEDIKARAAAAFSNGQQPARAGALNGHGGGVSGVAQLPAGQPGALPAPPAEDEDVEMTGMDEDQAIAGSSTGAGGSGEASQRRTRRHGSTVPTGIRAV